MQRILSILLICGILGQAFIRTAWTLQYQLNRASYIAVCVNKDKPMLHCDGKCAFKKQMAEREQRNSKEPQLPDAFREIKDIQLFFEAPALPFFCLIESEENIPLPPYLAFLPEAPAVTLFKPPAA